MKTIDTMKIRYALNSFNIDCTHKEIKDLQGVILQTSTLESILSFITIRYYYNEFETIYIHSDQFKNISGNYRLYLNYLIDKGIILVDERYVKGERSKGYMFTDYFKAFAHISEIFIDSSESLDKKEEKVVLEIDELVRQKIADDFRSIQIHDISVEKETLFYNDESIPVVNFRTYLSNMVNLYRLKTMNYKFNLTSGRLYTPFVQLSKTVRETNIHFDEDKLSNLDIKSSFPMWLAIWLLDKRIPIDYDTHEFFNDVLSGNFYNSLILKFNKNKDLFNNTEYVKPYLTKTDVKEHFMTWLNGNNDRTNLTNYVFRAYYPYLYEFVEQYKAGNKNTMYYELVGMESDFIFNTICKRIYTEIPDIKLLTCHDQIYFSQRFQKFVKPIWAEETNEVLSRIPYNHYLELDDNDLDDLGIELEL